MSTPWMRMKRTKRFTFIVPISEAHQAQRSSATTKGYSCPCAHSHHSFLPKATSFITSLCYPDTPPSPVLPSYLHTPLVSVFLQEFNTTTLTVISPLPLNMSTDTPPPNSLHQHLTIWLLDMKTQPS